MKKEISRGLVERLDQVVVKVRLEYMRALHNAANELVISSPEEVDTEDAKTIADLASYSFNPRNYDAPYAPWIQLIGEGRSCAPEDLSAEQLEQIAKYQGVFKDHELNARISDVLWILEKNRAYAELACQKYTKYCEQAAHESSTGWSIDECALRAWYIAKKIRFKDGEDKIKRLLSEIVQETVKTGNFGIQIRIAELALKHKLIERPALERVFTQLSDFAAENEQWLKQEKALKSLLLINSGNKKKRKETEKKLALCKLKLAEGSHVFASASYLAEAYKFGTQAGDEHLKITINKRMREAQNQSRSHMGVVRSKPIDISDQVRLSQNCITGEDVETDIKSYCLIQDPPNFDYLIAHEKNLSEKNFLTTMFCSNSVIVDEKGRELYRFGNINSNDPKVVDKAWWEKAAHSFVEIGLDLDVCMNIGPAWGKVCNVYQETKFCWLWLLEDNPLIVPSRKSLWQKALTQGFQDNLCSALHIAVPQFENGLRYFLENRNVPIYTPKDDSQNLRILSELLREPEFLGFFSDELIDSWKAIFDSKAGANVRNNLMHGIYGPSFFQSNEAIYSFWLICRSLLEAKFGRLTSELPSKM